MFNLIKLGLYMSLVGEYRLDPMVFELINHERRLEESKRAAARAAQDQHDQDNKDDDLREAA